MVWCGRAVEQDPKKRFTDRAVYYAKYRPRYPEAILDFMERELRLSKESAVADIGSGTGILSELFLRHGHIVLGVEPNDEMRRIAEDQLKAFPTFRSVKGSAEETTLPSGSVDFVTAAQSFHWFEQERTRKEFLRILKPQGWVILIWNTRRNSTPFMQAYERLVTEHATRPHFRVTHERVGPEGLKKFFGDYGMKTFENTQTLDLEGLEGRLLSSSYVPLGDSPEYASMLADLHALFNSYQENGSVRMEYDTEVYYAQLR
jgi:ubiquinone/menaquinone biosynthesis C-methylase UbiE